ncbi:MAG: hypothetical protein V1779_12790 [bacterium]
MKIFKILVSILFIVQFAFAGNNKPIFQIKPENIDFLRYFFISNLYDSAKVVYRFGEVKLNYGNYTSLINLARSMDTVERKSRFGTSEQGVSYDLQSLARTENFQLPNTGFPKITFFRGINESGQPCKPDKYFYGYGKGEWDIVDRTEFVLQLVTANNDFVMAVLDSVVSMPNRDPHADSLFGTNPHVVFHEWVVPPFLFDSTVYLRVSPRRYGPTPLGLIMSEQSLWANYGSLLDSNGNKLGIDNQNYLDSVAWGELRTYLDSIIFVTGELPFHDYHVPQSKFYEYWQLYFSDFSFRLVNGDTLWYKETSNPEFPQEYGNTTNVYNSKVPQTTIRVYPVPTSGNIVSIEINSIFSTFGKIRFSNIAEGRRYDVWKGAIVEGENKISIDISAYPSGSYSVIYEDTNNHRSLVGSKINIVR